MIDQSIIQPNGIDTYHSLDLTGGYYFGYHQTILNQPDMGNFNHPSMGQVLLVFLSVTLCYGNAIPDVNGTETAAMYQKQTSPRCPYPCKCDPPNCMEGVSIKKDGCGCCPICTRQQGDVCDANFICDKDKKLYCDFKLDGGLRGICRAEAASPCAIEGVTYKDGEEFKLNCSLLCTCQNGQYACSTLCPQEDRPPSHFHCKDPMLVRIEHRCCKEWVCPHSHSLPDPEDNTIDKGRSPPIKCERKPSEWTPCSKTCGMGLSVRVTNDNKHCETVQERRLCFIRPCDMTDDHLTGKECKSTWKDPNQQTLMYDGCHSVMPYRLKFCSTCKKRKCCGPGKTRTTQVQFRCPDGKMFPEKFMWIKNCECHDEMSCPF